MQTASRNLHCQCRIQVYKVFWALLNRGMNGVIEASQSPSGRRVGDEGGILVLLKTSLATLVFCRLRSLIVEFRSAIAGVRSPFSKLRSLFAEVRSLFAGVRSLFSKLRSLFAEVRSLDSPL